MASGEVVAAPTCVEEPTAPSSLGSVIDAAIHPRSVFLCMALIALAKLSLATVGFGRTLRWVRWHAERGPLALNCPGTMIEATERTVALAAAFYPGRAMCLERSIVLYDRLRRHGTDVQLRFGVRARPFGAHAWVAHAGRPINDSEEHVALYATMPEFDA